MISCEMVSWAVPIFFVLPTLFLDKRNKKPGRSTPRGIQPTAAGHRTQSYSSVGQSATLIMWRSAVQVCLGLLLMIQNSRFKIHNFEGRNDGHSAILTAEDNFELWILHFELIRGD
jgi:hypothetical protein